MMFLRSKTPKLKYLIPLFALLALLALAACGGEPEAVVVVELPPTWTPTPYMEPTPEPPTATPLPPAATNTPLPALPTNTPIPAEPTEEPTPEAPPTATPAPVAKLTVTGSQANLRKGPGTAYDRVGVVRQGDEFVILGKNAKGDWWQIQVNGQPAWLYQDLVQVQNPDIVVVAANIPAPPALPTKPP
ncbi:MAG TPA: SH3 domain-containing protein, partial [Caldilineae bacterium]|nr:SH3 domain-containing protein [Caldilineae bacterium]